ncbi:hypothetical protein ACA910_012648 [Epithemia clementina (nom. ined.)]
MTGVKREDHGSPGGGMKSMDKVPISNKRPTKKKPKDKPKRPLSAYNFFFKEEREKILKVVLSDEPTDTFNEPDSEDYIDDKTLGRLRKEGGKVSFEEMGKLIGQRWKNLQPDRLTKYSELAAEDTDRYKKEMQGYNGRQEAKMRSEALKPQPGPSFQAQQESAKSPTNVARPPSVPSYEMPGPNSGYGAPPPMQAYAYPGMDYGGYPGMSMGAMYGYGGYPGMGQQGAVPGGMAPPPEMSHGQMMPPEMQQAPSYQQDPNHARVAHAGGMYGGPGGYQSMMMAYGAQGAPPPHYQGGPPIGSMEHPPQGMYGYGPGPGQGWGGPHG